MKSKHLGTAIAAWLLSAAVSHGQGLLSIGSDDDFYSALPFTTSIGIDTGWDSNPSSSSTDEQGSAFVRGGVDMAYGGGSRVTPVRLGGSFSTIYYLDDTGADEDIFYSARITLNVKHSVSRRLTIGNNAYIAYEIEPDFAIGASNQRRLDQYLYGYNSLWASYAWTRRFTTITRYTVSGIRYDDSEVGDFENRFSHTVAQELRYALSRVTTAIGEYRFTYTNYESAPRDYTGHHFLVGVDHELNRNMTAHLRAGVELRDDDLYGEETRPYGELALRQRVGEKTRIHWANRIGLDDSELRTFGSRYSWRSTLSADHQISPRLSGNAGLSYIYSDYEDSEDAPEFTDHLVSVSLGLRYRLLTRVDLNTNYTFTSVSSDAEPREFDRHRVSVGLSTTF